jgi:hypothetical protein
MKNKGEVSCHNAARESLFGEQESATIVMAAAAVGMLWPTSK